MASKTSVVEQAEAVQAIAKEHGGKDFVWATKPEERTQLWQARHDAYFACLQIRPGSRAVSTDVCVPISRLAECVRETMEDVKNYIAPVPLLGHIGDGNFHLMLLVDPAKPEETEIAKTFNKRLVERALKMEGTCTGEHGVGLGKIGSMRLELGDDVVDVMRDIKKVFDPRQPDESRQGRPAHEDARRYSSPWRCAVAAGPAAAQAQAPKPGCRRKSLRASTLSSTSRPASTTSETPERRESQPQDKPAFARRQREADGAPASPRAATSDALLPERFDRPETADERRKEAQGARHHSSAPVTPPVANYVNAVRTGNLLYLAGKGPARQRRRHRRQGHHRRAGLRHARTTGLNLMAVMSDELGSLDRVKRIVKVLGMVNAVPGFTDQPKVINGCSDLFVEVFGERGKHARSAVGMGSLPNNIPVEIEVIVEVGGAKSGQSRFPPAQEATKNEIGL